MAVGLGIGLILADQISVALRILRQFGVDLGGAALTITIIYIAYKWGQRKWLFHRLKMARISVDALNDLIASGTAPVIIDVRSPVQQEADPFLIPGAVALDQAEIEKVFAQVPKGHPTIVYCACPNEVSAALMAKRLHRLGLTNIRPLAGGIDAWRAAGFPVSPVLKLESVAA
jgi:rhodanese-related sulfurtransferase